MNHFATKTMVYETSPDLRWPLALLLETAIVEVPRLAVSLQVVLGLRSTPRWLVAHATDMCVSRRCWQMGRHAVSA